MVKFMDNKSWRNKNGINNDEMVLGRNGDVIIGRTDNVRAILFNNKDIKQISMGNKDLQEIYLKNQNTRDISLENRMVKKISLMEKNVKKISIGNRSVKEISIKNRNTNNISLGNGYIKEISQKTKTQSSVMLEHKLDTNVYNVDWVEEEIEVEKEEKEQRLDTLIKDLSIQLQQLERDLEERRLQECERETQGLALVHRDNIQPVNCPLRPKLFRLNVEVHQLLAETEERPLGDVRRHSAERLRDQVVRLYLGLDMLGTDLDKDKREAIIPYMGSRVSQGEYEQHVRRLERFHIHLPGPRHAVTMWRRLARISAVITSLLAFLMILLFLMAVPHCCDTGPFTLPYLPYRLIPILYGYGPKPF